MIILNGVIISFFLASCMYYDMSWILPGFTHDISMFWESFICIQSIFRVFTGSCTYWKQLDLLDHFGALRKALLKTWSRSRLSQEASMYEALVVSINTTTVHEFNDDLSKLQVLPRSSKNYTISPWPPVRLFIRVFYCF